MQRRSHKAHKAYKASRSRSASFPFVFGVITTFCLPSTVGAVQGTAGQTGQTGQTGRAFPAVRATPGITGGTVQAAQTATAGHLLSDLKRLAGAMGVSFVLEGDASRAREVPPASLLPRDKPGAGGAVVPPSAEVGHRAELEELARRFDYSVETVRGLDGVYVLKKRYSRPDDLPEITLEECAASLSDINKLITPFDSGIPSAPALSLRVQEVLASFTEEQRAVMRRGGRTSRTASPPLERPSGRIALSSSGESGGRVAFPPPLDGALPVSSLSKEQREVVTGMAVATYTGDALRAASNFAQEADWLVKNGASLRWGELRGGLFLGYESPFAPPPGIKALGPLPPRAAGTRPPNCRPPYSRLRSRRTPCEWCSSGNSPKSLRKGHRPLRPSRPG